MKKIAITVLLWSSFSFGMSEFYSISRSIRSLGMGGAFYALSDDEYALFYNPAGLSNYRGEGQFLANIKVEASASSLSGISTLTKLKGGSLGSTVNTLQQFQGKPMYVGTGIFPHYLTKNFAIGLLIADTKADIAVLGKDIDTSVDVTAISDSGIFVGYGRKIVNEDLHVGFTLKGLIRAGGHKNFTALDIAQGDGLNFSLTELGGAGAGIDIDLGAIYDIRGLPWGDLNQVSLVFNNLLASDLSMVKVEGQPPKLQRMLSLGARSVLPGYGPIDNFHLLFDISEFGIGGENNPNFGARTGSIWKHVNFGVEMPMNGWFIFRAGFHQGNITAGFGVRSAVVQLDFATYSEELLQGVGRLSNRRFGLRLAIGGAGPQPGPIEPKEFKFKTDPAPTEAAPTEKPVEGDQKPEDAPKVEEPAPKVEEAPKTETPAPATEGN